MLPRNIFASTSTRCLNDAQHIKLIELGCCARFAWPWPRWTPSPAAAPYMQTNHSAVS